MYFVHPQLNKKKLLFLLKSLFSRESIEYFNEEFSLNFPGKSFYFTDMGRTAFRIIVEKLNLRDCEMIFPAFICDIFIPILKEYGITPKFVDIDIHTFHMNVDQVKNKITKNTKAIVVSHTFGLIFDIKRISQIPDVEIIEDGAHAFGLHLPVGKLSTVSFFSLYKQFPIARGGLLICPKDWEVNLRPSNFRPRDAISIFNSLPPFALLFKKFGKEIAPKMIRKERSKEHLALNQFSLNFFLFLHRFFKNELENRIELALFFQKRLLDLGFSIQESRGNIFTYLSVLLPKKLQSKRDEITRILWKNRIFCTRIWHTPIVCNKMAREYWKISKEEFPNTIEVAERIINLPLQNYYSKKDIERMVDRLKKILSVVK